MTCPSTPLPPRPTTHTPTHATQRIKMSPDGQYVVATGTYPPAIRVYEVSEMSMKFERRLTAEVRWVFGVWRVVVRLID
jgi:6-phosphogluconolactonase (cycloisomerase 2 family)